MKEPAREQVRAYYSGRMSEDERDEFELRAGSDPEFAARVLAYRAEDELESDLAALRGAIIPPANLEAELARERAEFWRERLATAFRDPEAKLAGALEMTIIRAEKLVTFNDRAVKGLLDSASQNFVESAAGATRTLGTARPPAAVATAGLLQLSGLPDANIKADARKPEVLISFLEGTPPAVWLVPDDPREEPVSGEVARERGRTTVRFGNLSSGAYVLAFQPPPLPESPFDVLTLEERTDALCRFLITRKSKIEQTLRRARRYDDFRRQIAAWRTKYLAGGHAHALAAAGRALFDIAESFDLIHSEKSLAIQRGFLPGPVRTRGGATRSGGAPKTPVDRVPEGDLQRQLEGVADLFGGSG